MGKGLEQTLLRKDIHTSGQKAYGKLLSLINHSVQSSRSVVSNSLRPHELQHTRPPSPSPTPGVYSNSCPSSWWCHPAISSSVVPFSSCPQLGKCKSKPLWDTTSIRMTSTKATESSQCWQERGHTWPPHTLTEVWKGAAAMGQWTAVHQKSKDRVTIRSSKTNSASMSKRIKRISKKYLHNCVHIPALFTITKRWKQPKRLLKDEMLDKDGINMQRNIIQPLKRKGNSYTCCNMDEHWGH